MVTLTLWPHTTLNGSGEINLTNVSTCKFLCPWSLESNDQLALACCLSACAVRKLLLPVTFDVGWPSQVYGISHIFCFTYINGFNTVVINNNKSRLACQPCIFRIDGRACVWMFSESPVVFSEKKLGTPCLVHPILHGCTAPSFWVTPNSLWKQVYSPVYLPVNTWFTCIL